MSNPLRDSLIERHGEVLGPVLYEAELEARRKTVEKLRTLQAQIDAAQNELSTLMETLEAELDPLRSTMEEHHAVWLRACEVYEQQRLANQSALAPLQNRITDLLKELYAPSHQDRVKQWQRASWYDGPGRDDGA